MKSPRPWPWRDRLGDSPGELAFPVTHRGFFRRQSCAILTIRGDGGVRGNDQQRYHHKDEYGDSPTQWFHKPSPPLVLVLPDTLILLRNSILL